MLHIISVEESVSLKIAQCHIKSARLKKMAVNF